MNALLRHCRWFIFSACVALLASCTPTNLGMGSSTLGLGEDATTQSSLSSATTFIEKKGASAVEDGPISRSIVAVLPTLVGLESAEIMGARELDSSSDSGVGAVGLRTSEGIQVDVIVEADSNLSPDTLGNGFSRSTLERIEVASRDNGSNLQVVGVEPGGMLVNVIVYYNDGPAFREIASEGSPFERTDVEGWVVTILTHWPGNE